MSTPQKLSLPQLAAALQRKPPVAQFDSCRLPNFSAYCTPCISLGLGFRVRSYHMHTSLGEAGRRRTPCSSRRRPAHAISIDCNAAGLWRLSSRNFKQAAVAMCRPAARRGVASKGARRTPDMPSQSVIGVQRRFEPGVHSPGPGRHRRHRSRCCASQRPRCSTLRTQPWPTQSALSIGDLQNSVGKAVWQLRHQCNWATA